jgi:hypothetical protein
LGSGTDLALFDMRNLEALAFHLLLDCLRGVVASESYGGRIHRHCLLHEAASYHATIYKSSIKQTQEYDLFDLD